MLEEAPGFEARARPAYVAPECGEYESVDPERTGAAPVHFVTNGTVQKTYLADDIAESAKTSDDPRVQKAFGERVAETAAPGRGRVSAETRQLQNETLFPAKGRAPKRPKSFYRQALHVALAGARMCDLKPFCKRRGWKHEDAHSHVEKLSDSAAREALVELSLANTLYANVVSSDTEDHLAQLHELVDGLRAPEEARP